MFDLLGLDFYRKEKCFCMRFVIFDLYTKKKSFTILEININFNHNTMTCEFWKKVQK
jgi:hypothetical protein